MIKNNKIHWKCSLLKVIVTTLLLSQPLAMTGVAWQGESCDQECPGAWVATETFPRGFRKPQIQVDILKQRFDFKKKIMSGEEMEIVGKSLWIRAKKTQFADSAPMIWSLKGPVLAWIDDLYIEGDSAIYNRDIESFEAKNIEFFFQKYQLHGSAKAITKNEKLIEITDLCTSSCPPSHQSWSFKIQSMTYDMDQDHLVLYQPGLFIHDYQILQIDRFEFDGLRAKHSLQNFPGLHVETNSGLALQLPIVWTKEEETLALIPEVNTKQGLGIGAAISKNKIHAKGFIQLLPFQKEADEDLNTSWMASVTSEQKISNFAYGYQGALVSDPSFCYRYPGAIDFWEDLYLVNYGWMAQETGLGKITLSTEKLYRSQEAREQDYEVIEYLGRLDWTTHGKTRSNVGADVIHRYGDQTYQRFRWESEYDLGAQRGFQLRLSAYPWDETYTGALLWATHTPSLRTSAGCFELFFAGSVANEQEAPLLLDTIAQPIGPDFFTQAQWHTGLDWNSPGAWVTPRWSLYLTPGLRAELSMAYALKAPKQPWEEASQPYLTPFREDDRFSPLSVRFLGDYWTGELLWDVKRGECVMAQWGRSLSFEESVVDLRVFFHEYYPMDRLSETVESVAQFGYAYHSQVQGPWQVDFDMTWDLIPVQVNSAALSVVYDDCCWQFALKTGADQQYDPDTGLTQWHYRLGLGLEIYGFGMLDSKTNPWNDLSKRLERFVSKNNY